jgi:hypothetical protein
LKNIFSRNSSHIDTGTNVFVFAGVNWHFFVCTYFKLRVLKFHRIYSAPTLISTYFTTAASTSTPFGHFAPRLKSHKGRGTGAKARMEVGAALGGILAFSLIPSFSTTLGQRQKSKAETSTGSATAELGASRPRGAGLSDGEPLTLGEKLESVSRRRAAELSGKPVDELKAREGRS